MIEEFVHSIEAEKPLIVDTKGMGQAYLLNLSERNNTKSCEALGLFFEYFEKNYRFAGNLSNNFAVYFPYAD